jgi:phosphate-selective porin OprO/OprP
MSTHLAIIASSVLLALPATAAEPEPSLAANTEGSLTKASLASPAGPTVSPAQLLALQAQIDHVQQRAVQAEQRAQIAEEKVAAVSTAPVTGAGDKGFVLRSPDNAFAVRFKGLVAFDGKAFAGDPTASVNDGFTVRKLRPVFEATVLNFADLRFMPDFAGSKAAVVDAFIDVRPTSWLKIRAGKFIAPVGLERSQQDTEIALVERSLTANLAPVRDLGVVLHLDPLNGFVHFEGGVVNGGGDNTNLDSDNNKQKDAVGRLLIQPFRLPSLARLGALAIGVAGSTGVHRGTARADATALGAFVTPGQNTFFQYLASATDPTGVVYADGLHRRLDPQAFYYVGPFGLLAEYALSQQRVTRNGTSARLTHRAWHATANYVFGGLAGLNGVTVTNPFLPAQGKLGALELALRVGQLRVDPDAFPTFADPARSARGALEVGGAASLYFNRNFKLSLNYEQVEFQAAAGSLTRPRERVFLARTQFLF